MNAARQAAAVSNSMDEMPCACTDLYPDASWLRISIHASGLGVDEHGNEW